MPIISPTNIVGRVEQVLVNDRSEDGLESYPAALVDLTFAGIEQDVHGGLTRSSCVRVKTQYPVGTEIRNTRQLSLVSNSELEMIANELGIGALPPGWLGANIEISGIDDFSMIPPSSRLIFESGAGLVVDCENGPCRFPGEIIDRHHPGLGTGFVRAARNRRGVTGWVERTGKIRPGDRVSVHVPPQRRWSPLDLEA